MDFSEAKFYENYFTWDFYTTSVISRPVCLLVKMASRTVIRSIYVWNDLTILRAPGWGVKKNNELHGYSTRRRNDYHLPKVSTNWGKQMLKYCTLNDWNSLELGIRESSSLFSFKSKMSI